MTTISIYPDPTIMDELIHETLDEITNRIPASPPTAMAKSL